MNFVEAQNLFLRARDNGKFLQNNTRLLKTKAGFGVQLHSTIVVEIFEDKYRLNTGGWLTHTTKDRLNNYQPSRIFQKNHIWYVNSEETPYFDGIEVDLKGRVISKVKKNGTKKQEAILKKIDNYIKGYMNALAKKKIPTPSHGDCWHCCMKTKDGTPLGDSMNDTSHILNHFKERYFVPSLLVNAIKDTGYNVAFINPWNGFERDNSIFKRALKKYLKKILIKGAK